MEIEEKLKNRIIEIADTGLGSIDDYFKDTEVDPGKVSMAFKILNQATKVLHMNQVRVLTERSQALRLLRWLPNDEARNEYIKITNPKAAPLLLKRPES